MRGYSKNALKNNQIVAGIAILIILFFSLLNKIDVNEYEKLFDDFSGFVKSPLEIIIRLIIPLLFLIPAILISKKIKISNLFKYSPVIYVIYFLLTVISLLVFYKRNVEMAPLRWIYLGDISIYFPTLLYPGLLFSAYLLSRLNRLNWVQLDIIFFLTCFGPLAIIAFLSKNIMSVLVIMTVFWIYVFRVARTRRLKKAVAFWGIAVPALLLSVLLVCPFVMDDYRRNLLEVLITHGKSDPYGEGWFLVQKSNAFEQAKLFGQSNYMIEVGGKTVSSGLYLAYNGNTVMESVITNNGWISFAIFMLSEAYLCFYMFKLSVKVKNVYVTSISYIVAVLNIVRLFYALNNCFNSYSDLVTPFMDNYSTAIIDLFVLTFAVGLCYRKIKLSPDTEIEREFNKQLLAYYSSKITEKLVSQNAVSASGFNAASHTEKKKSGLDSFFRTRLAILKKSIDDVGNDVSSISEINRRYSSVMESANTDLKPENGKRDIVFISYNHNDLKYAELLSRELEKNGIKCWYYDRDVTNGSFAESIMSALKRSKMFVVLLTEASNESEHVYNEVSLAFNMIREGVIIMPVKLEKVAISDELWYYLCRQEVSDATKPPVEEQIRIIARKIENVLK